MPPKKGNVISTSEARVLMKDPTSTKYAVLALQVLAGDRVDDPRFLNMNQTDASKGSFRPIHREEFDRIRAIVHKLAVDRS